MSLVGVIFAQDSTGERHKHIYRNARGQPVKPKNSYNNKSINAKPNSSHKMPKPPIRRCSAKSFNREGTINNETKST